MLDSSSHTHNPDVPHDETPPAPHKPQPNYMAAFYDRHNNPIADIPITAYDKDVAAMKLIRLKEMHDLKNDRVILNHVGADDSLKVIQIYERTVISKVWIPMLSHAHLAIHKPITLKAVDNGKEGDKSDA